MNVRLISKSVGQEGTEFEGKSIDEIVTGIARLSSSRSVNDLFDEPHKLLRHCLWNSHWSVFSTANLTFEVTTSRAIGREYLRHWSISPQELSQRYQKIDQFEPIDIRMQSTNNRQSSTDTFDPEIDGELSSNLIGSHMANSFELYDDLLNAGVARECARGVLPETTQTKLIMNGKIRDWITTLNQRLHKTAQKEAREVAEGIRDIFIEECPVISKMLFNFEDAYDCHILERILLENYGVYQMIKDNDYKKIKPFR